ncbi:MAG: iron-sulfur cluster assembly scaffold protein [Robiginitomaculum sp.]|nr:MAG: iron-sulfur cluster assembly scaffold protein [Robiginitomaculum sp.]
MLADLYTTDIMSLAANIKHVGRLEVAQSRARKVSKLCGSWVEVDINMQDGTVTEFAIRLQACALGQASAAILAEYIMDATYEDVATARDNLHAMLKDKTAFPNTGRFAHLGVLSDIANYPARHASTMLAFEAALDAMKTLAMKTLAMKTLAMKTLPTKNLQE